MSKFPWSKFYWVDWYCDAGLARCSLATRGAWMDILCLMHQSEETGILRRNGIPWTPEEIKAGIRGECDIDITLRSLEMAGVIAREADGSYYSKRMVRDENRRNRQKLAQVRYRSQNSSKDDANVMPKLSRSYGVEAKKLRTGSHNNNFSSPNTKRGWIDRDEERQRKNKEALDAVFRNRETRGNISGKKPDREPN